MDPKDFTATAGPIKVQRFLDYAAERDLTVTYDKKPDDLTASYAWTIKSGSPIDDTELWLFWTPGANGGRLGIHYYRGPIRSRRNRKSFEKITRRGAFVQMGWMREALERHLEREAARARVEAHNTTHAGEPVCTVEHPEPSPAGRRLPCVLLGSHVGHQDSIGRRWGTVVTNGSDLSPGMRMAIHTGSPSGLHLSTRTTVTALANRGLATDEGNGWCRLTDQGRKVRAALETVAAGRVEPMANMFRADSAAARAYPADPTDPHWFREGQVIRFRGVWLTVVLAVFNAASHGDGKHLWDLGVTVNGGHGRNLRWYAVARPGTGDRPLGHHALEDLFTDEAGLAPEDLRAWPKSLASAHEAIRLVMREQCLEGWSAGKVTDDPSSPHYVVVHVPEGINPARHLALLERYAPYPVRLELARRGRFTEVAVWPTVKGGC